MWNFTSPTYSSVRLTCKHVNSWFGRRCHARIHCARVYTCVHWSQTAEPCRRRVYIYKIYDAQAVLSHGANRGRTKRKNVNKLRDILRTTCIPVNARNFTYNERGANNIQANLDDHSRFHMNRVRINRT